MTEYARINTRKINLREITSLPETKNVMSVARHIAENKPHAHRETHLHTMKVYNSL